MLFVFIAETMFSKQSLYWKSYHVWTVRIFLDCNCIFFNLPSTLIWEVLSATAKMSCTDGEYDFSKRRRSSDESDESLPISKRINGLNIDYTTDDSGDSSLKPTSPPAEVRPCTMAVSTFSVPHVWVRCKFENLLASEWWYFVHFYVQK